MSIKALDLFDVNDLAIHRDSVVRNVGSPGARKNSQEETFGPTAPTSDGSELPLRYWSLANLAAD